jgi:hypothetical protein
MGFPWDPSITLKFQDTSHLDAYPLLPHLLYRGRFQMVLTVEAHPLVTMFSKFFRQLPGHPDEVVGIPLNLLIVALANVCARPIADQPAFGLTLGRDMLLPDAMELRLRIAIEQCGLPVVPYTPASFRAACDLYLSPRASLLAVDRDCFFTPQWPEFPTNDISNFPLFSDETRSGLLITLSEIQECVGPVCLEDDNDRDSSAASLLAYMIDTFVDAAAVSDHSIKRMPDGILFSRIHRMLEESRWPKDLARPIDGLNDAYVDISDRIVLWQGTDLRSVSRILESRVDTWLKSESAAVVVEFLGSAVSQNTAHEIAAELAKLLPLASLTLTRRRELDSDRANFYSFEDFPNLCKYLSSAQVKAVWTYPTNQALPLRDKVAAILSEHKETEASQAANNDSTQVVPLTKGAFPTNFGSDMSQLLMTQLRTTEYRQLEDQLTRISNHLPPLGLSAHHQRMSTIHDIPLYYLPLSLIFSSNGAEIVKRFVLTPSMRVISRDIFRYIDELRSHWPAYANLRCIWDERSELKPEMLVFKSSGESINNARKGRIAGMNVMVDIYERERIEVRYSKVQSKHNRADLTNPDSTVKNTYAKYMDRILSAVGFKCAATSADGKEDSHMAVMTAISDFCEQADPLNGARKKIMRDHAMSMLTSAELEAQDRFISFLTSKNPAAPFPGPYLAEGSPTKTLLAKKFTQLRSILDLQGFDDSILNTGAVTLSGIVHATMHTQFGLFKNCLSGLGPHPPEHTACHHAHSIWPVRELPFWPRSTPS